MGWNKVLQNYSLTGPTQFSPGEPWLGLIHFIFIGLLKGTSPRQEGMHLFQGLYLAVLFWK